MIDEIIERFDDVVFKKLDGFDEALLGVSNDGMRLIYSVSKCLDILCKRMSELDALEYFDFNIVNAYVGENTPIFCYDNF